MDDGRIADTEQYFHDLRMVWSFAGAQREALAGRGSDQLGDRSVRVSDSGTSQSDWQPGDERGAIEDPAGNHNAHSLCPVRVDLPEREAITGLSLGRTLPFGSRLFRVPQETDGHVIKPTLGSVQAWTNHPIPGGDDSVSDLPERAFH